VDRRLLLITPYALWILFLVAAPFGLVFATSLAQRTDLGAVTFALSGEAFRQLADPLYFVILQRTVVLALAHTLLTLTVAYPVAFFLSRVSREESSFLLTLLMVPFWTNFLVRLLAFMDILRLQPFGLDLAYTPAGMLAAMLYNYFPFAVLPLYSALTKIPSTILEAAQDLGASKRRVFLHVLWPLTRRAVVATGLLVFIPALGEFLIPVIVGGGRSYYLGNFLHQQFLVTRNWPLGSAAIVALLGLSFLLVRFGGAALLEDKNEMA
jgi:spermidine/putrescine transport system permease protein